MSRVQLEQALNALESGQRGGAVRTAVDSLTNAVRHLGLYPTEIIRMTVVLRRKTLKQRNTIALIKCLLPSQEVPFQAVRSCLSWMNTSEVSDNIKAVVFRWIITTYPHLDDPVSLTALYAVIFQYMKNDYLRRYAVDLLLLITRKEDVTLYRVQRIKRLRDAIGRNADLDALLALYKFYLPNLVPFVVPTTQRRSNAGYQNWVDAIRFIHERRHASENIIRPINQNSRQFWESQDCLSPQLVSKMTKKSKLRDYLPPVQDLIGPVLHEADDMNDSVSLHCICSLDELFANIDKISLPRRSLATLRYPILQNLMSCWNDKQSIMSFSLCLRMCLYDDFIFNRVSSESEDMQIILGEIVKFSEYVQEELPVVSEFLIRYVNCIWNGEDFAAHWLKLITRMRFSDEEELTLTLFPIKRYFIMSSAKVKADVIYCLTRLTKNLLTVEMERFKRCRSAMDPRSQTPQAALDHLCLFNVVTETSPLQSAVSVIDFTHDLCRCGILIEDGDGLVVHAALSFYSLLVDVVLVYGVSHVVAPPPVLVYMALFSLDAVAVSKVCSLVCRYKDAFDRVRAASQKTGGVSQAFLEQARLFNAYLMDISNSLWRCRAFERSQVLQSLFNRFDEVSERIQVPHKGASFSVLAHPAFSGFVVEYDSDISKLTTESGFLPTILVEDRASAEKYIKHLAETFSSGLQDFVSTFIVTAR